MFPMRMSPSEYRAGAGLISLGPPSLSQGGGVTMELVVTDSWFVGAITNNSESSLVDSIVGAHMLICIYAQSQSKYISVFSSILFLYYFHFTVLTPFQFFFEFFPIFLAILFTSKACHFDTALLIFASV